MDIKFDGKRILVTGAGRGIGRELSKVLATRSTATVFALGKTQEHLDSLKAECPNIETVCVDLSKWDETKEAVKKLLPIHGLVNNAAYAKLEPFLESTEAVLDQTYNVNVKALINVAQVVAQDMKDRKCGGSIVNLSSQASQAALMDHLAYCMSKGAVDIVTKVMALEMGPYNIRVNCVNPTVVLTDMGRAGWADPKKSRSNVGENSIGQICRSGRSCKRNPVPSKRPSFHDKWGGFAR